MEAFVILAVAAGLSAVVVWWATNPPGARRRPKAEVDDEPGPGRFVLVPSDSIEPPDDRPPPAVSLVRLAVTITFFAALGVGVLAVLGLLVKTQLDHYFTGL